MRSIFNEFAALLSVDNLISRLFIFTSMFFALKQIKNYCWLNIRRPTHACIEKPHIHKYKRKILNNLIFFIASTIISVSIVSIAPLNLFITCFFAVLFEGQTEISVWCQPMISLCNVMANKFHLFFLLL